MNRFGDLSPQKKRELLVKLLQKKAKKLISSPHSVPEELEILRQFAISVLDLNAEAVLDPAISPQDVPPGSMTEAAHIFLTGATGFLGAFLLRELLQQTRADIYCLVRCSNTEEGKERIQRNLESYLLGTESRTPRIIPVAGDLSKPLLGLSTEEFQMLAKRIDIVYHSGASVNWFYSYNRLKTTNVLGTQEVLRLASQYKVKPLHYVSTISVFPATINSEAKIIQEQDTLDHGGVLYGGYSQSKWVAEKLAMTARTRGLPVCIYRPGLITGHSQTGTWNTNDATIRMIKTSIEAGYMPDLDVAGDMTPVDYVSRAIVYLSSLKQSPGKVFHLTNPRPVLAKEFINCIRSFGYPLQQIPYGEWRVKMIDLLMRSQEDSLSSLGPLFSLVIPEKLPKLVKRMLNLDQDTIDGLATIIGAQYAAQSVRLDCRNTIDGLSNTSIACPAVDDKLLKTYFSYLISIGFLNPPPQ